MSEEVSTRSSKRLENNKNFEPNLNPEYKDVPKQGLYPTPEQNRLAQTTKKSTKKFSRLFNENSSIRRKSSNRQSGPYDYN